MNQKELKELIEFLIEKDIAEFELERGDVKVRIKRGGEHSGMRAPETRATSRCTPAATLPCSTGSDSALAPAAPAPAEARVPEEELAHGEVSDRGDILRSRHRRVRRRL